MKLIKCHIENFGKLHDFDYTWTEGINCITKENGWGKSTFMAFIKCMFYGLAGDNKKSVADSERKKYTPWQGGIFGGRILFESGGKQYEVIRTWGKKSADDTCLIIDAATRLGSKDWDVATSGNTDSLGRRLFGIDEDSFARSAYIAQGDVPGGVTGDINAKISNITDNTDDMCNYEKAMETFKDRLNQLSETRQTGKLYAVKSELNRLKGEINLEQIHTDACVRLENQKKDAEHQIDLLTEKNGLLSRQMEIMSRKKDEELIRQQFVMLDTSVTEADAELKEALSAVRKAKAAIDDIKPGTGLEILGIIMFIIGVALIAAGAVLQQQIIMVSGAVIAAAGAVIGACGIIKKNKTEKEKAIRRDLYIAASSGADAAQKLYNTAVRKRDDFMNQHKDFRMPGSYDVKPAETFGYESGTEIADAIKDNLEHIDQLRLAISGYEKQIEEKQDQISEISDKRDRADELEEMMNSGREKIRRIELARDLMMQAKTNMTSKYIDPISERFSHYLGLLTGNQTDRFIIDADTKVSVDELGGYRESELMSTGIKDAIGFCLRLALADAMYKDEKPPLIMDDTFVNMDDNNRAGAEKILSEVSSEYQIIYFTCHGNK